MAAAPALAAQLLPVALDAFVTEHYSNAVALPLSHIGSMMHQPGVSKVPYRYGSASGAATPADVTLARQSPAPAGWIQHGSHDL